MTSVCTCYGTESSEQTAILDNDIGVKFSCMFFLPLYFKYSQDSYASYTFIMNLLCSATEYVNATLDSTFALFINHIILFLNTCQGGFRLP